METTEPLGEFISVLRAVFAATLGPRGSLRILEPGGTSKTIIQNSTYGRYLPSGHVIYCQAGALFAAPFDLDRKELTGLAVQWCRA